MHVEPVVNRVRATLLSQGVLAGGDPAVEGAISALAEALDPALQLAALELAQQAATEVGAQLPDGTVEVVAIDGDLSLRVTERSGSTPVEPAEDFDARITLRLPPSLKQLIEDSASGDGDSVNSWVVEVLSKRAKRPTARGRRTTEGFDL